MTIFNLKWQFMTTWISSKKLFLSIFNANDEQ